MKNKLIDIHNLLVATLEDLDDPDLLDDPEKLKATIDVAKAKADVTKSIIELSALQLDAAKFANSYNNQNGKAALPELLRGSDND